ncbi:chemotaxis protein CheB, partial [bacterium]
TCRLARIDTIVIGASAGGVEAISTVIAGLPSDLPAAVFVVLHVPEGSPSMMPAILNRQGALAASHPHDQEPMEMGRIYVARPGYHMLLKRDTIRLVAGPKENGNRPAIDPLFRTAARSRGPSVVGVLLTGMLDDGTLGMNSVRQHGGITIAQDPETAYFGDMPRNAIRAGAAHHVLPLEEIASRLVQLVTQPNETDWEAYDYLDATEMTLDQLRNLETQGRPSPFVCPECSGTLFELQEDGYTYYRCHVGHAYSVETLDAKQEEGLEAAMWTALRAIEEHNMLLHRLLERSEGRGMAISVANYRSRLAEGAQKAAIIRNALETQQEPHERIAD